MKVSEIKKFRLIVQDTFNKLEVGKIYNIKNLGYSYAIVSNICDEIILYSISKWQLENMFEVVNYL